MSVSLELVPADEFLASHSTAIAIQVSAPVDTSTSSSTTQSRSWGLRGQTLSVTVSTVAMSVKELKELLVLRIRESGQGTENMPLNKFQLKVIHCGLILGQNGPTYGVFLKDSNTLATHNIDNGYVLEVSVKSRR